MEDPQRYADFIDKVVKFRIVRMCYVDGHDQEYRREYCLMAECDSHRCFSEPTNTIDELKHGITMYEGMVNFLHRNAFSYMDEEDIFELKKARELNPELKERTTIMIIHTHVDELLASEKEAYPGHHVDAAAIKAQLCWEEEPEPPYRRGGR